MNFTEAVNEAVGITKRPDKIADIRREINAAINYYCMESDFSFDRQEQTLAINANEYAGNILLSSLTRFRKVDCIRPINRNKFLDPLDPKKIFTPGGCEVLNVYYIAGTQINYKLSQGAPSLLIAYYSFPPTLTGTESFWMLDMSPYMVINRAASVIFTNIGDDSSARIHKGYADEAYISASRDYKYGANPK